MQDKVNGYKSLVSGYSFTGYQRENKINKHIPLYPPQAPSAFLTPRCVIWIRQIHFLHNFYEINSKVALSGANFISSLQDSTYFNAKTNTSQEISHECYQLVYNQQFQNLEGFKTQWFDYT